QWVGSSCGLHGPYIFYKAFKFSRDGRSRILALGDFFFVRCHPEEPICVADFSFSGRRGRASNFYPAPNFTFYPRILPRDARSPTER
ncbi:unnamed protein product, partial [Tetraodon nigroviridis]